VELRANLRVLRGKCSRVIGIDPDLAGASNPFVDEFRHTSSGRWPVNDESIDLCVVDSVLEHVEEPNQLFSECRRVIKAGGFLCIRTPNTLGYATVMARLIPESAHVAVLRLVQNEREPQDIFPAHYRCNTARRVRRILALHSFESCVYGYGSDPAYLDFSTIAYGLGAAWVKFAPKALQCTLFAFARKLA
jgi:SAM-dependent methyltransferase